MVGYSADDYLRFSADKETIYYSEPVYACEDAYVLPTNDTQSNGALGLMGIGLMSIV